MASRYSRFPPTYSRDGRRRLSVQPSFDAAPTIADVIGAGLGEAAQAVGSARVVKVSLSAGDDYTYLLNRLEFSRWLSAKPRVLRVAKNLPEAVSA
jgi:hypothetical protein